MKTKNIENRKRPRRILIAFLMMLSFIMTTGTFAYWATSVEGTSEAAVGTLTIGSADGVETEFILSNELNSGGTLVPLNQIDNSNELDAVETIDLVYHVKWAEASDYSQLSDTTSVGKIVVTYDISIESEGEILDHTDYTNVYRLIHVIYGDDNPEALVLDAAAETFSYQVSMDEPSNLEEYNLINNSKVSIVFTFSIKENHIDTTDDQVNSVPYIDLIGDEIIYVEIAETYVDQGYIAYDSLGDVIDNTWMWGSVNLWKLGTYTIYYQGYSATDDAYTELATRTVIVIDTQSPSISVNGDETYYLPLGYDYNDSGAYALDNSTEEIEVLVSGLEDLDINTAGSYVITYYAVDASGNESMATRTVVVG